VAGVLIAPFVLSAPGGLAAVRSAASPSGAIFLPWQLWWFLGNHDHVVFAGLTGIVMQGYRAPPGWIGPISHPLVVALGLPLTLAAWLHARRAGTRAVRARAISPPREADALLLLALLLALRFMLDPWDNFYYPIPFVLALVAWEGLARKRPPLLAVAATAAVWASHYWRVSLTPDAQAAFFAAWSVPLASGLALALYAPGSLAALVHRGEALGHPREHLVPALGDERLVGRAAP